MQLLADHVEEGVGIQVVYSHLDVLVDTVVVVLLVGVLGAHRQLVLEQTLGSLGQEVLLDLGSLLLHAVLFQHAAAQVCTLTG